jgi:branched-chain amino acid aminotransferase
MIKKAQARTLVWPTPQAKFAAQPVEQRFTAGAAYVDGQFCPIEEARIPLLDWGFLRSDACQETICRVSDSLSYKGGIFFGLV